MDDRNLHFYQKSSRKPKMAKIENKMPRRIDFDPLITNISILSVFGAYLSVKKRLKSKPIND